MLAAVFALTRAVVHLSGNPYFDPDSYKYLSGADSLLAGKGLPPLYNDLALNGGALHVVPGYSYLAYAMWHLGGITLRGLAVAQSVVSFLGFLALAHLIARWVGPKTAIAVFVVLCLSPSIAWLEHSLTPDSIAAPLLMISLWAAALGNPADPRLTRRAGGAILSGLLTGLMVLMRTSSQAYAPLPWLLAVMRRAGLPQTIAWTSLYVAAALAPLAPWLLHNYDRHRVFAVAVSSGRNLYFNAVWAGTLDRTKELAKYGIKQQPVARSAYPLADAALQRQIAAGASLPHADRKLGEIALEAYKAKPLRQVADDRLAIVLDLFVPTKEHGAESMTPLGRNPEWYLANQSSSTQVRETLEQRFRYRFSDGYVKVAARRAVANKEARRAFTEWIRWLSFDGMPLLLAFLAGAVLIVVRSPLRWPLAVTLAAPPLVFLAAFAFFGAPLYRYQAGLHPFMLATVVVALSALMGSAKRRLPAGFRTRRRLAGYGQSGLW